MKPKSSATQRSLPTSCFPRVSGAGERPSGWRRLELVSELRAASRISRRPSRMAHSADGGARDVAEIQKAREARRGSASLWRSSDAMRLLYVDLEREWRGGQSQAFLTLGGLRERGQEVELLAARDSPLAIRVSEAGITVHQVPRFGLRGWAARACADYSRGNDLSLCILMSRMR